ncbi:MAG: aromatic amino acid hydroxylase, partial [Candidatus Marinimicrobia bacterium]|nr:aromatic amino acid hydroxylase [Candidatus Neomarinimicrobiota bacterium]
MSFSQEVIFKKIPKHLHQFIANQDYEIYYNARDQAVWRYVMRQLSHQLKSSAHPIYNEGLGKTGISIEKIPSIEEMNKCLSKLGWMAIVVDGFIPPQAFMELQELKVLAIALDMRSIEQILYTPAPDIVHESAGHAPMLYDTEYSVYLHRFGEIGVKAMFTKQDKEVYEAMRHLSIMKGYPSTTKEEIKQAEKGLNNKLNNVTILSESALLTRLHWWTVEYGLVGTVDNYTIYGAGLLSSLSESKSCL